MNDGWIPVCPLQGTFPTPGSKHVFEVPQGGRKRKLLLIRTQTGLSCMDAVCGHAGGPLYDGDIESLGDACVITCPWHRYTFDVRSGKHVVEGGLAAQFQKTHPVTVKDGLVYIKLLPTQFGTAPCPSERFSVQAAAQDPPRRGQKKACGPAAAYRARRRQLRQTTLPFTQVKAPRRTDAGKSGPEPLGAGARGEPPSSPWALGGAGEPGVLSPNSQSRFSLSSQSAVGLSGPAAHVSPLRAPSDARDAVGSLGLLPFSMSQDSTSTVENVGMDLDDDSDAELTLSPYRPVSNRLGAETAPRAPAF